MIEIGKYLKELVYICIQEIMDIKPEHLCLKLPGTRENHLDDPSQDIAHLFDH
jgi:hypothetical protein